MPYKLEEDADARHMLERLKKIYVCDEGHIIRALLRERLEKIDALKTL